MDMYGSGFGPLMYVMFHVHLCVGRGVGVRVFVGVCVVVCVCVIECVFTERWSSSPLGRGG